MPPKNRSSDKYEKVHHPRHYNSHPSGIECIEIIEYLSFNVGNAIKYFWRAGLKPGEETIEDLKKGLWYINREITKVTKELERRHARELDKRPAKRAKKRVSR